MICAATPSTKPIARMGKSFLLTPRHGVLEEKTDQIDARVRLPRDATQLAPSASDIALTECDERDSGNRDAVEVSWRYHHPLSLVLQPIGADRAT